jgi:hypothetical protein
MTTVRTYKHQLVVHVASEVDKGQRLMQDRLLRWIAAYGHTASSFGFEFEAVGVITAKRPNMVSGSIMTGDSDD